MVERAPFLNAAYSAYHHRGLPAEDTEMTRVGPDTPCGEYPRRFWQPVILAGELGDLPRRVRILGEDLIVFRDKSGAAGLLEPYCPHRGTSLEFGGIRAVAAGEDLGHPTLQNGSAVPTYSHDRVIPGIAVAPTPEADRRLLREVARDVVAETVKAGLARG